MGAEEISRLDREHVLTNREDVTEMLRPMWTTKSYRKTDYIKN